MDTVDTVVARSWERQSVWSQAADKLKKAVMYRRRTVLALAVIAAFSAALVAPAGKHLTPGAAIFFGWLAAVCAAVIAVLQKTTGTEQVQAWTRARSVAEAYKAEIYTFLAGVPPYRGQARGALLNQRLSEVTKTAEDLIVETIQITPKQRPVPAVADVESYAAERVQKQITGYYEPQSIKMRKRARQFRTAEVALAVVGAVVSATASFQGFQGLAAWLPVITTVTTVVMAEAAFQRYDALALEYARTGEQLRTLIEHRAAADADPQADEKFVHDSELVLSIQNEAWLARRNAAPVGLPDGGKPPTNG